jgi:hypothetical protein
MKFQILPHVLRTYQPNRCPGRQPNIDFSMGFPYPWLLKFTDITIPSHHTQDGKRYDAEVVMTHVYSKNNPKKMVSIGARRFVCSRYLWVVNVSDPFSLAPFTL